MFLAHRLAWLTRVTASTVQPVWEAVDVETYKSVALQVHKPELGTTGTLVIQHAAVRDEGAFVDVPGATFDLSSAALAWNYLVITNTLRFLRWKVTGLTGTATFQIDLLARPNLPE